MPTNSRRILACPGVSRVPAPRPIDSIVERRQRSEPLDDGGEDRGAGRGCHLAVNHRFRERNPAQQLGRRRRRQRHPPVGGLDPAAARRHGAGLDSIDAQQVEPDCGAHDIGDRVDRAHLVKVDLGEVDAVNGRLGFAQLEEDTLGQVFLAGAQAALVDQRFDVMPVPVDVLLGGDDLRVS